MSDAGGFDPDPLAGLFLPPVESWFSRRFGSPTPPQKLGWPAVASGQNTLIVSPTGSGKTLAAFLAALDHLWKTPRRTPGVGILYISPLKALNEDVHRNLTIPLEGILEESEETGFPLRPLTAAVRSGDTKTADRARLVRKPPDILITTPESLHLMLTSRARDTLRGVSHVIVDEIHALCGNKRGVFLALLLERLERLNPRSFVRIGLSATQRPLEEVARYLGGRRLLDSPEGDRQFEPRPVTIVDAGTRRNLDLEVLWPGDRSESDQTHVPSSSIWPSIEREILRLVSDHRSTIVFANNRRTVERLSARLNEQAQDEESTQHLTFRAHHGSLNLDERRVTEALLKQGELSAVVATASLELGIDVEAVELVCQVESPGSVSRGLQRVGRAGHIVGGTGKGVMVAKTPADLLETAALCREMRLGNVEPLRVPTNCLDILAQQLVATVALERWDVPDLFDLVRCADPFRNLTAEAFESILKLISGRFEGDSFRDLRARVVWDRVHNRLAPLPGTARVALSGGGAIPDTGQYPVYLGANGPRLGELDEEFVYERRVGESFLLGNATWRIEAIEPHRVVVGRSDGGHANVPFWRGENAPRSAELGQAIGALCGEIAERLDDPGLIPWLGRECSLDPHSARKLIGFVRRQIRHAGAIPDEQTVLVESFRDPAGELGLAILTSLGGKLNHGLKLAIQAKLRDRFGIIVSCLHADEGVLVRLPRMEEIPLDLLEGLNGDRAEAWIRDELVESALFGLRFRQNAARALLMPRPDPTKRTPLWLQRLRAKDLLQIALRFPDFPIVIETFRECLDDDLDLPRLRTFLDSIQAGSIRVVSRDGEIPSPMTSGLVFRFTAAFLYQWDEPRRADRRSSGTSVDDGMLDRLLRDASPDADWLDPRAIEQIETHLRGGKLAPRSAEEMAELLRKMGDMTAAELSGPMPALLEELESEGRAVRVALGRSSASDRWILAEHASEYRSAFPKRGRASHAAIETIVRRYLQTHALVALPELVERYPIEIAHATELLERWVEEGGLTRLGDPDGSGDSRWIARPALEEIRRATLSLQRRGHVAVPPEVFADFLTRHQHIHPETVWEGETAFELAVEQFQGYATTQNAWEQEILPRRVRGYRGSWLDESLSSGEWTWRAIGDETGDPRVAFVSRDFSGVWPISEERPEPSDEARLVLDHLTHRGASFVTDLSRGTGLEPSRVRIALRELTVRGLVTNDCFDPLRAGGHDEVVARLAATAARRGDRLARARPSRRQSHRPEGRWSIVEDASADAESSIATWAEILLGRYGVLSREMVAIDPWAPAWSKLADWLSRAEWRGEARRGYFVEGLSGVQYASAEAAEALAGNSSPAGETSDVFLSAIDPANLYGSGAPFDIPLLEGGTARFSRIAGNYLVLRQGRPVLIVESHGKRLTGLGSASTDAIHHALRHLPSLATSVRRVLKIETYNGVAASNSPIAERLTELGFVRDYPGMAYYRGLSG